MKKGLALILVFALMTSVFAGCGGGASAGSSSSAANVLDNTQSTKSDEVVSVGSNIDETKRQELIASHTDANGKTFVTVTITDDPGAMHPHAPGSSKPRQVVLEGIFECLFNIQGTGGELAPVLAERYEEVDENTFRVYLKDYIYDSEGNHFTANDVYFSLQTIGIEEYNAAALRYVDAVNVIDDYTVDIVFNTKMYNYRINALITYLYTQAAYEASPDGMITTPVGTGPYKMTSWVSGSEMVFETYDGYWEKDASKIVRNSLTNVDKIVYKIIKEGAQRVIALESGNVDISTGISASDLDFFLNSDDYNIFNSVQDQVVSLFFNCSDESPLQDVRVRQAIAYAIDNQGVIDGVDQGYGEVCHTAFHSIFPDYDPAWENEDYYNYNVEKAKELLKEAGYEGGNGLTLTIMFENNDRLSRIAQVMQGYLLNVGITLEIFPCDGALFTTYRFDKTKFDIAMATTGSSTFGSNSLIGNLPTNTDANLIGIQEDVLFEKITVMAENAYKDWSYAHDLHYYIKDNCYTYMLYAPINFTVTSKAVTGLVLNQKGQDSPNCCTYIWND